MIWNNPERLYWLLALLPLLIVSNLLIQRRGSLLARMTERGHWPTLLANYSPARQRLKNGLRLAALAVALLAFARPQWGAEEVPVQENGLSMVVALDTSKSMLVKDVDPDGRSSRLDLAKQGIRDLVRELKGDRIGLVAFSGGAFLQCPITFDYSAFMMMLDDIYAGIIPVGGTDLYEALDTALEGFEQAEEGAGDKVIILISDGEGHTGDPMSLLPRLKEQGIRIFTIGVGSEKGKPIMADNQYVKDADGHMVTSTLNEAVLKKLALETGGMYVRSALGDFGMDRIITQGLAHLHRAKGEERIMTVRTERFPWFIGGALLLLLLEALIRPTKKGVKA